MLNYLVGATYHYPIEVGLYLSHVDNITSHSLAVFSRDQDPEIHLTHLQKSTQGRYSNIYPIPQFPTEGLGSDIYHVIIHCPSLAGTKKNTLSLTSRL
jgi:hypothetical protein